MLTEVYKNKIKRYLAFYKFIYRFRILLIILACVIVGVTSTLLSLKGLVIDTLKISDVQYGEKLTYSSTGLFDNYIHYEFKKDGSNEWSQNVPKLVGKYQIRGVSKNIFGGFYYGKPQNFEINPKICDVTVSEKVSTYGDIPTMNFNLLSGDEIVDLNFTYNSYGDNYANVSFDKDSVVVVNKSGEDVSYCYDFNFENSYDLTLKPRNIVVKASGIYEYDGETHNVETVDLKNGTLANGDKISYENSEGFVDGGVHASRPKITIKDRQNRDVTKFYDIDYSHDSTIVINPRKITIKTGDFSKTYDGKIYEGIVSFSITEGSLINGDRIELTYPKYINAGNYQNKPTYTIFDKDGKNKSSNYAVTFDCGKYIINPIKLTLNFKYFDKVYSGWIGDNMNFSYTGNLLEGHEIRFYETSSEAINTLHVGKHDNYLGAKVFDASGKDVSINYEITIKSNSYEVTKRSITIKAQSYTFTYDGTKKYCPFFDVEGELGEPDEILITKLTTARNVGVYDNILKFEIKNNLYETDVTNDYDITFIPGKITILEEDKSPIDLGLPDSNIMGDVFLGPNMGSLVMKYTVKSGSAGQFLRSISTGVYDKDSFLMGPNYTPRYGVNVMEFIPELLKNKMKPFEGVLDYYRFDNRGFDYVPYYSVLSKTQKSDNYVIDSDLKTKKINIKGYNFDYVRDHALIDNATFTNQDFKNEERVYSDFVKQNYRSLPTNLFNILADYIRENNLEGRNLLDSLNRIIKFFSETGGFIYDMGDYGNSTSEEPIINFLTKTRTGVCNMFASSGAALLRVMGYPTRVVSGYGFSSGSNVGGVYNVTGPGHALCEVYVDGKGWVTVEFTVAPVAEDLYLPPKDSAGGDPLEDSSLDQDNINYDEIQTGGAEIDPNGQQDEEVDNPGQSGDSGESDDPTGDPQPGETEGEEKEDYDLYIYGDSGSFEYDGKPHSVDTYNLEGELKDGHTLEISGVPSITKVGIINNNFSYNIKDEFGNIVTDQYKIYFSKGTVSVTKRILKIKTTTTSTSLSSLSSFSNIIESIDGLAPGDKIVDRIDLILTSTSKGTYQNVVIVSKIVNEKGEDVTSCYAINYDYGTITLN